MRFPRDRRLADGAVFKTLLNSARRVHAGPVGARIAPTIEGSPGRLGITVAKRHLKRAVDRNTVKRLIREAYRRHAQDTDSLDVLISLRYAPSGLCSRQAKADFAAALNTLFGMVYLHPSPAPAAHG